MRISGIQKPKEGKRDKTERALERRKEWSPRKERASRIQDRDPREGAKRKSKKPTTKTRRNQGITDNAATSLEGHGSHRYGRTIM
ncbi:hypothetical protein NDU88_002833 [Pleurodeles waltl]|uniref:Uncharacterized protein n=1 Tax=Pleurodeles waltl TaxID=8319 RepID=A0AAV7LDJ9_PLEWA|nr:hypothetical protein NDU88_002833 [Pleurodeles waltl]